MAVAGRFMTKWFIVCGMVRILGGLGFLSCRDVFAGMMTLFSLVAVKFKRSSAA